MGVPIRQLYATNIDNEILLSKYIPIKKDDGYHRPFEPIVTDLWVPNALGLQPEENTVPVMIVPSEKETGIWLVCYDDYFGNEQHLYAHKPKFKEGTKKLDWEYEDDENNDFDIGLHISTDIKMEAGDGPYPVTLQRGEYPPLNCLRKQPEQKQKKSLLNKLKNLFKNDKN